MRRTTHAHDIALVAATAALVAGAIAIRAQQGGGAGAGGGKPLVPVAASSLALHPELYVGQTVSLTGAVEQILSKTVFTVDQDKTKSSPKNVLVVAPALIGAVDLNAYVTVVGDAVKFDPADVTRRFKDYTLDLAPDVIEKYRGLPAVFATAVINAAMTDLAKKPIPPPTPAEDAFDKVMKQVSPAFAALRQSVDASAAGPVKQRADELKKLFGDTEAFFKTRGTADATTWASNAAKLVDAIDTAAAGGKWDAAKTEAGNLNQLCTTCHTAHRERQDDGTYRVKG